MTITPSGRQPLSSEAMLAYLLRRCYADGDCLLWAGACHSSGAPIVMWKRQRWLARRLLLVLAGRRIDGKSVYDTCGESRCMNEAHLRAGTQGDALRNAARNGAYPSGVRRSMITALGLAKSARLGVHDMPQVLRLRAEGQTLEAIGRRYGVTRSAVGKAITTWRRAGITEWRAAA